MSLVANCPELIGAGILAGMITRPAFPPGELAVTSHTEELRTSVPLAMKRVVSRVAGEQGVTVARFVREAVAERVVRDIGTGAAVRRGEP